MRIKTVIFGKKVRKPSDIRDDVEFETYALEILEHQANNFIEDNRLTQKDIQTYKVKIKHAKEKVKREIKGGQQIIDVVDIVNVRILISYYERENDSSDVAYQEKVENEPLIEDKSDVEDKSDMGE